MLNRKHINTLSLLLTATMMISMTACSNRDEKNADTSSESSTSDLEPDPDGSDSEDAESESSAPKSTGILSGDSYVTSLTCDADAIDLNGHTLYVNGVAYSEGTASTGEAITLVTESSSDRSKGGPEGGEHDAPPSGEKPKGDPPSGKKEKKEDS